MKTDELMIGDWVMYENEPIMVYEIDDYYERINTEPDGYNAITCIEISDVTPISITREILEKNFVKFGTQKYVVYGGNSYITDMTNFFELHINFVDFRLEQQIFYVHQLQHALRLCGIEKEIKL